MSTLCIQLAIVIICMLVHILNQTEKKTTFCKIERSVATHLDIEKESKNQVQ